MRDLEERDALLFIRDDFVQNIRELYFNLRKAQKDLMDFDVRNERILDLSPQDRLMWSCVLHGKRSDPKCERCIRGDGKIFIDERV